MATTISSALEAYAAAEQLFATDGEELLRAVCFEYATPHGMVSCEVSREDAAAAREAGLL